MDLASIREEKKITQQELADSVSMTRQMISAIENNARPSVDTAKKIASKLEFDWTKFFEDETAEDLLETKTT